MRLPYEHWYQGRSDMEGFKPCQEPEARKWFVLVDDAIHPGSQGETVYDFSGYASIRDAFIIRCLTH
jgi:hypothetical protein